MSARTLALGERNPNSVATENSQPQHSACSSQAALLDVSLAPLAVPTSASAPRMPLDTATELLPQDSASVSAPAGAGISAELARRVAVLRDEVVALRLGNLETEESDARQSVAVKQLVARLVLREEHRFELLAVLASLLAELQPAPTTAATADGDGPAVGTHHSQLQRQAAVRRHRSESRSAASSLQPSQQRPVDDAGPPPPAAPQPGLASAGAQAGAHRIPPGTNAVGAWVESPVPRPPGYTVTRSAVPDEDGQ